MGVVRSDRDAELDREHAREDDDRGEQSSELDRIHGRPPARTVDVTEAISGGAAVRASLIARGGR
jgi:hypothetical protein